MLTCSQHHHSPHLPTHASLCLHARRVPPSASFLRLSAPKPSNPISACASGLHQTQQDPDKTSGANAVTTQDVLRRHNAKSTALFLHHVSHPPQCPDPNQRDQDQEQTLPEAEKVKILEMSLVTKRTPQFPGSIYVQSPSDNDVGDSLPPLHRLVAGEDEKMLMQALEIRRSVTVEIFMQSMGKGKFGITFSTNLVSKIPDFIDYIMIEAAAMKRLPEFSHSSYNARAKAVIHDSNVVPLIRWLKHHKLSYPQIGKLISLSRGKIETIRYCVEWLKSIHVKGRFVGATLMKAGEGILVRNTEELEEIVEYLESRGVRRDWMGFVISRCPQLLSYSLEEVKARSEFYLDMGMNEKDFGTMVYDYPKALGYLTLEEMNQKVNYLKEFGLNQEDIRRLLAFKPLLMGCSIEERWKPLVKYFYYLGIDRDGMRRVLTIKPMVFCVDLETIIVPKVRFFQDIGIRDDAIGNMLTRFPHLLMYSLYKKIRPVVIFLITKAGVSQRDVGKVIALGPELLGCSIVHKLDVNVKYFLSLGIRVQVLGAMIADFPMLLRYNIDLLRLKYRYLRRTMVRPLQDLIEFPRYFSYSLDDRIIPRHQILVNNRLNFKLRYMLTSTDEDFNQRVQAAVERRQRFESMNEAVSDPETSDATSEKRIIAN